MRLKTLRVERRKDGTLRISPQLSTNPSDPQETYRIVKTLKDGGLSAQLEAISAEIRSYARRLRRNLSLGNPALQGLPQKVTFRDSLKAGIDALSGGR